MRLRRSPFARWGRLYACHLLLATIALPAASLTVTVTHDLPLARPAETITVPWSAVARALPGALLQHLAVRDAAGRILPYQVTNIDPHAKDPQNLGLAYGDLLFQYDFAAGESSATFTVEKIAALAPVFPTRTFARFIPERLDDFAWENDKLAHRTYGPALAAPAAPGSGKEVLVTSGLDLWCKRVTYPIVDRWYNKGHDHYHQDEGEGMDLYQVGSSRGCGGTGLWDGQTLAVGQNFSSWKILANGPLRTVFELTYAPWDAHGLRVAETKRFTVDAGHHLDLIESTFTVVAGEAAALTVAIGLNKAPGDKGQDARAVPTRDRARATLAQWVTQKSNGQLGTAIVVNPTAFTGFAEDEKNELLLARVTPGQPLRYLVGAAWERAGEITSQEKWLAYLATEFARLTSPVKIAISAEK